MANLFEKQWQALGTDISLQIANSNNAGKKRIEEIFSEIKELYAYQERVFSRFDPQSELSWLNAHQGEVREVSPDMLYLIRKSYEYYELSGGIFDPRILGTLERIGYEKNFKDNIFSGEVEVVEKEVPRNLDADMIIDGGKVKFLKKMDFSGIAKGYITDRAAELLVQRGFYNFLMDSGGDMFASGHDSVNESWGIALEGSKHEDEILVEISDEAVATSGNVRRNWKRGGKRYHHLINPYLPEDFSFAVQSVTVVEQSVEKADAWAKILFLLGQEKGLEWAGRRKIKAYFLQLNGNVIKSKHA